MTATYMNIDVASLNLLLVNWIKLCQFSHSTLAPILLTTFLSEELKGIGSLK